MSERDEASDFRPMVGDHQAPPEFTLRAILIGICTGILFGASNAYLGLGSGLTISTSIPIAVMTIAVFKALQTMGSRESLLEANLAQTVGSAPAR